MIKIKALAKGLLCLGLLSSCSTDISEYRQQSPALDIKDYFTGDVIAWGMLQDASDKVTRRFCVEIIGRWQSNKGTLAEIFYFDDGEVSQRTWQLTKLDNGQYQGSAEDVVGTAYGEQQGFAFNWRYNLLVPVDGTTYELAVDDWIYQLDDKRLFNKTQLFKFGIGVAKVTLFFEKLSAPAKCNSLANI